MDNPRYVILCRRHRDPVDVREVVGFENSVESARARVAAGNGAATGYRFWFEREGIRDAR